MFYYISGKLALLDHGFAVVDAGGVGYKLTVSQTTYEAMPAWRSVDTPPEVRLYTYMSVREDCVELFGFATTEELGAFTMLISVSGVGPRAALSILSLLTPEKFSLAVCSEDVKTLSKAAGVGAKTAARIVLELKDKLMRQSPAENASPKSGGSAQTAHTAAASNRLTEAQDALTVLGYSRSEAISALRTIDTGDMETGDIIKAALNKLSKN